MKADFAPDFVVFLGLPTPILLDKYPHSMSPADGALGERADAGQLEVGERLADVALRDAQLDPALLEPLRKRLQLPGEDIVTARPG